MMEVLSPGTKPDSRANAGAKSKPQVLILASIDSRAWMVTSDPRREATRHGLRYFWSRRINQCHQPQIHP